MIYEIRRCVVLCREDQLATKEYSDTHAQAQ